MPQVALQRPRIGMASAVRDLRASRIAASRPAEVHRLGEPLHGLHQLARAPARTPGNPRHETLSAAAARPDGRDPPIERYDPYGPGAKVRSGARSAEGRRAPAHRAQATPVGRVGRVCPALRSLWPGRERNR
jgi:hypothetical protein